MQNKLKILITTMIINLKNWFIFMISSNSKSLRYISKIMVRTSRMLDLRYMRYVVILSSSSMIQISIILIMLLFRVVLFLRLITWPKLFVMCLIILDMLVLFSLHKRQMPKKKFFWRINMTW